MSNQNIKSKQTGFTLLELIIVLGLAGLIAVSDAQINSLAHQQAQARQLGVEIYQYNNAVRSWVARNTGITASYVGTQWLKSSACGGTASIEYLPCNFNQITRFGNLAYTTTVSSSSGVTTASTAMSPLSINNQIRPDLAGLAALTASGGTSHNLFPGMIATDAQFSANVDTAVITFVASNASNSESWLRIDGSNQMTGRFRFNPTKSSGERAIQNIASIINTIGTPVSLGNNSIGSSVVINADADALYNLHVRGNATSQANIIASDQISAGVDLIANRDALAGRHSRAAGTLTSGQLNISRDTNIGRDLTVYNNTITYGDARTRDLVVQDDVQIGSMMTTQNLIATTSDFNSVYLSGLIQDANNTYYFIDPQGTSSLNRMSTDELAVFDYRTPGSGCSPNGSLARTGAGSALNCVSGRWETLGGKGSKVLGLYYYNTMNYYPASRWGAWSSSLCSAQSGRYQLSATSSRRRTSQGIDITYLCTST